MQCLGYLKCKILGKKLPSLVVAVIESEKLQAQDIIAPVDPGVVMNASPVVWHRKKTDLLGFVPTSNVM